MVKVFPVQKGDICQITKRFNNFFVRYSKRRGDETTIHPAYGDTLIVVSDPSFKKVIGSEIYVETYNQVKMEYFSYVISVLERI